MPIWTRKIDKKMHSFGDIDEDKKVIRVNPKKQELLNTILHEEAHRNYPDKSEKEIKKITEKQEKELTPKKAIDLLKRYVKTRKQKKESSMPLPTPREGQSQDEFIGSCMSSKVMKKEFPESKQRVAICYSQFRKKREGSKPK